MTSCTAREHGGRRSAYRTSDVHALVAALDDVVDFADEAADQLGLYAVEAPMEVAQQMTVILVSAPMRSPPL